MSAETFEAERFEYGIVYRRRHEMHREGFTEKEAREWVAHWVSEGGDPAAFVIMRRPIGSWEQVS